jgi:hypothetical protein
MTEDHATTLGGQDASFTLQLKWISVSKAILFHPLVSDSPPHWALGVLISDAPFPNTETSGKVFCKVVHILTVNSQ